MEYDAELIMAFLEEIEGYLPQFRSHLAKLETKAKDRDSLDECYRLAHTIKGTAGMMGLHEISQQGQVMEQALLPVVEKKAPYTHDVGSLLRTRIERVDQLLAEFKGSYTSTPGMVVGSSAVESDLPVRFAPPSDARASDAGFSLDFDFDEDLSSLPGFAQAPAINPPATQPSRQPAPPFTPPPPMPPASPVPAFDFDAPLEPAFSFESLPSPALNFERPPEPVFQNDRPPAPFTLDFDLDSGDTNPPTTNPFGPGQPEDLSYLLEQDNANLSFDKFEPQLEDATHQATNLASAELTNFVLPDWIGNQDVNPVQSQSQFQSQSFQPAFEPQAQANSLNDLKGFSLDDILTNDMDMDAAAAQLDFDNTSSSSRFESEALPSNIPVNEVNLFSSYGVSAPGAPNPIEFDDLDLAPVQYRGDLGVIPPFQGDTPDDFTDAADLLAQFDHDPGMLLSPDHFSATPTSPASNASDFPPIFSPNWEKPQSGKSPPPTSLELHASELYSAFTMPPASNPAVEPEISSYNPDEPLKPFDFGSSVSVQEPFTPFGSTPSQKQEATSYQDDLLSLGLDNSFRPFDPQHLDEFDNDLPDLSLNATAQSYTLSDPARFEAEAEAALPMLELDKFESSTSFDEAEGYEVAIPEFEFDDQFNSANPLTTDNQFEIAAPPIHPVQSDASAEPFARFKPATDAADMEGELAPLPDFNLDFDFFPAEEASSPEAALEKFEFNLSEPAPVVPFESESAPITPFEFSDTTFQGFGLEEPAEKFEFDLADAATSPGFIPPANANAEILQPFGEDETTVKPFQPLPQFESPSREDGVAQVVEQVYTPLPLTDDDSAIEMEAAELSTPEISSAKSEFDNPFDLELTEEEAAALAEMQAAEAAGDSDEVVIDFDMGALWLAEAQSDIDRLNELISEFDENDNNTEDAAKIKDITTRLRKGADMMDLENITSQLGRIETAADAVLQGELKPYMSGADIFNYELAGLMILVQPYQQGARDYINNVEAEQAAVLAASMPAAVASAPEAEEESEAETDAETPETLEPAVAAPLVFAQTASPPVGVEVDEELAIVFATEAEEHIQNLDTRLAQLERNPNNRELLREIRRTAHTLKGSAAMVGFNIISQTAHLMEDLLDRLFDGSMAVSQEVVELLFATFNAIDNMVRGLSSSRPEDPAKLDALRPRYAALLSGVAQEEQGSGGIVIFDKKDRPAPAIIRANQTEALPAIAARTISEEEVAAIEAAQEQQVAQERAELSPMTAAAAIPAAGPARDVEIAARVPIKRLDGMMNQVGELVINRTVLERRNQILAHTVEELALSIKRLQRVSRELETRYEVELLKNSAVNSPSPLMSAATVGPTAYRPGTNGGFSSSNGGNGSNGMDYARTTASGEFDTLEMDQYTEFHTLSREMSETVADLAAAQRELDNLRSDLENVTIQQSRISDDLQDKLVKVRLVPISNLTPRLYRTVRTIAASQKKEIEFVVSGENTQVDKTIFEEIGDPLLHIIRNAVDHGIESPVERQRQGKPEKGTITFAARNEGGLVVIEVRDDGAGFHLEDIRQRAIEKGFIQADAQLTRDEIYDLTFLPGFSTSVTISDISGRGIGMDVVRSNILKLKGTIEIQSEEGQGTAFIIRLPTTLAITRALLVRASGYSYAIPLNVIEQSTRFEPTLVEDYGSRAYYKLGEERVPLLELGQILHLPEHAQRSTDFDDDETDQPGNRREQPLLVIAGPEKVVLRVDKLLGQPEVVVKGLGTHIKYVPGVIGATTLGSGEVVLILNLSDLIAQATGKRTRATTAVSAAGTSRAAWERVRTEIRNKQTGLTTGSLGQRPRVTTERRTPLVQVVDDSLSMRKVLSSALEKAGYRVRTSKDGQEALETIQHSAPDLILMDIEMPRMDGYELTSLLKSREAFYNIPIVMLTSRAGLKHRQKAEEVGADGFLVKPYKEEELLQIVATLLERAAVIR